MPFTCLRDAGVSALLRKNQAEGETECGLERPVARHREPGLELVVREAVWIQAELDADGDSFQSHVHRRDTHAPVVEPVNCPVIVFSPLAQKSFVEHTDTMADPNLGFGFWVRR